MTKLQIKAAQINPSNIGLIDNSRQAINTYTLSFRWNTGPPVPPQTAMPSLKYPLQACSPKPGLTGTNQIGSVEIKTTCLQGASATHHKEAGGYHHTKCSEQMESLPSKGSHLSRQARAAHHTLSGAQKYLKPLTSCLRYNLLETNTSHRLRLRLIISLKH